MGGDKEAKKLKSSDMENGEEVLEARRATLFVKVNFEGYAVGRKINIMAHNSYESLCRGLRMLFNNFFNANYANNPEEDGCDDVVTPNLILFYEDHEGDKLLVGDVPWELFIVSVKRLYIARRRPTSTAEGATAEE